MNFRKSPFSLLDNNTSELNNSKDYPTIADLMRQQEVSNDKNRTVHHRRDLDSLG